MPTIWHSFKPLCLENQGLSMVELNFLHICGFLAHKGQRGANQTGALTFALLANFFYSRTYSKSDGG